MKLEANLGTPEIRLMEKHIEFTNWAVAQGIIINGITAHKFAGRGLGIIAEKNFKVRRTDTVHWTTFKHTDDPYKFSIEHLLFRIQSFQILISSEKGKCLKMFLHDPSL
jgi:hypothetical protein